MVYKFALDVEGHNLHYLGFKELLIEEEWDIALLSLDELSVPLIKDFYYSNLGYIQAKVGRLASHLRSLHIAEYLHVLESRDEIDIVKTTTFLVTYLSEEHMINNSN